MDHHGSWRDSASCKAAATRQGLRGASRQIYTSQPYSAGAPPPATCIGIKGEAIAAEGIISCDSVVWATSVVRRRSQGPLSPVADPFKSKPKPVPGTVPIFKFDEHPNMKPIVFAAFALSVAAVVQGVSLEIKPFKRLIPADRLRGE